MNGGVIRESPDSSAQSKSPSTLRNFMHGNRETSGASVPARATDRREKAESHTARMHAPEESDRGVVPKSRSNNEAQAKAESEKMMKLYKQHVLQEPVPEGGFVPLNSLGGIKPAPVQKAAEKREEVGTFGD